MDGCDISPNSEEYCIPQCNASNLTCHFECDRWTESDSSFDPSICWFLFWSVCQTSVYQSQNIRKLNIFGSKVRSNPPGMLGSHNYKVTCVQVTRWRCTFSTKNELLTTSKKLMNKERASVSLCIFIQFWKLLYIQLLHIPSLLYSTAIFCTCCFANSM